MNLTSTVYFPPRAKTPWRLEDLWAPGTAARFYGHGRNALAEALKLCEVSGGKVLLPSFICRDLLSSVAAAGAKPVFYGVGPSLSTSEDPSRWPEARAVVAVDYFGFPQDLAPFEAYARLRGAVLIEDAAHALLSRDSRGRLLGTRAPLGILSPRKSLPLPNGGALLANEPAFAARLPPQAPFQAAAERRSSLKAASRPWLALAGARAAHAGLTVLRALRGSSSGHREATPDSELVLPEPAAPCPQLAGALACADADIEVSRRRALWSLCAELARRTGLDPVFSALPAGVAPYGYPFRAEDFTAAQDLFGAEGLTALPWPDLPAAAEPAPPHHRNVGLVHFLW